MLGHRLYFTAPQELLHGLQEIFLDEIYKQELPQNARILDCGANIGLSIIYFKQICPTASITAFEPDAINFELLKRNIRSFGLQQVDLQNMAVWKESTQLPFSVNQGMASHIDLHSTNTQPVFVNATRLRDWLTQPVDFLKIDIEGAEFEVLSDCDEKLKNVQRLFIEYHGLFAQTTELTELFQLLERNGFNFYIKEATPIFQTPFLRPASTVHPYQVQLNIFCFRN